LEVALPHHTGWPGGNHDSLILHLTVISHRERA